MSGHKHTHKTHNTPDMMDKSDKPDTPNKPDTPDILELIRKMGGFIDENGMLQLRNGFLIGERIPPHSRVFEGIAQSVEKAYGETGLRGLDEREGRMIHQFRMYIDRHNIAYIRRNFKRDKMTDEEALKAYVHASQKEGGTGGTKMLREPARFHNKYPAGSSYRSYQKGHENKKRLTADFHSEFIIDRNGNFVSQWNVLEEDEHGRIISDIEYYRDKYLRQGEDAWEEAQRQIMDTESFNYASKNDKVHQRLDIQPPGFLDYDLRRQIAEGWKSPCRKLKSLKELKNLYCYHSDKGDTYSV